MIFPRKLKDSKCIIRERRSEYVWYTSNQVDSHLKYKNYNKNKEMYSEIDDYLSLRERILLWQ